MKIFKIILLLVIVLASFSSCTNSILEEYNDIENTQLIKSKDNDFQSTGDDDDEDSDDILSDED